MNARLYDPVLGRMISPDNFVNGAFASQAYNRYSYANNNPLKYTDPSGNNPVLIAMAIAAAINIGYQVMYNEGFNNFNVESLVLATLQGGISAGFAGAIGDALSTLTGFTKLAAGIALHGLSGGIQSAVFGGNIGQGVLSGMIGHGVGELFVGAGISQNMGLLGNFVVGGMSSALVATAMGNDPMQAFIIGGATAAFNSFMHGKPKKAAWDLNGDGKLQKDEADNWWIKGEGKTINIDNSKIDWSGLELPLDAPIGSIFSIETHSAFIKLPWETASTYGGTSFQRTGLREAVVLDQKYHYGYRPNNSVVNTTRNFMNWVGKPSGQGADYMIHYLKPTIRFK